MFVDTQSFLDIIPEDWKEAHMLRQEVQIRSLKSTLGQKEAHISKLEAALQCYQLSRKVSFASIDGPLFYDLT